MIMVGLLKKCIAPTIILVERVIRTISRFLYDGQEKTVTAVDGGVDMQAEYGYTLSLIRPLLPKFDQ